MQAPDVRRPAVAGRFYPSNPEVLARDIEEYVHAENEATGRAAEGKLAKAIGCIVPHAGYMYSGHVAGAVYRRLPPRSSYIILAPNHFGRGAPLAIMSAGAWLTPLGTAPINHALARSLTHACHLLVEDAQAHAGEHSLEVQLPFLQHLVKEFSFVPVSIGVGGYAALESLGHGVAQVVRQADKPVFIIASSDMNHYEPDDVTRIKDRKAIDQILTLDPHGLYEVIRREDISMCGYGPAVAMLTAARELGATRADLVKYATSADTSGDRSTVVGYAGIVVS
ncbi:MAG TPA: AmmeMemoRadiSam system protein B [Terriglobia bacterium]|nr:AmmeMemoRadiSam system protein B [Terriglobia bacterium]